jgi:N-acetylmuramoyl-L-alanine amidase
MMGVISSAFVREKQYAQRTVVLDPAGDAKRTGRRIGDSFERGLTLQCVERIKEIIEERAPHIKVIVTRKPGDYCVYDLQNATLANRVADFFVSLHFYHTQDVRPTISLYQFSYGNDFVCCEQGIILHSYDQAYRINKQTTDTMCQLFKKELSQQKYHSLCSVAGPYALPLKPLIGIVPPCIALELGLKGKDLWQHYSEPVANAIIAVVDEM